MESIESILGEKEQMSSGVVLMGLRNRESVLKYFSERFGEKSIKAIELFDFGNGNARGWLVFTETRILFYINQDINEFKKSDLIKWNIDDFKEIEPKEISENKIEITKDKSIIFDPEIISKKRLLSEINETKSLIRKKLVSISDLSNEEKTILLRVYIGQNINEGLLYKFKDKLYVDPSEKEVINSLISKELIKEIDPYSSIRSIKTLITLKDGSSLGKKIIEEKLKEGNKMTNELKDIPKKILGFLFLNIDSLIFNLEEDEEWISEWEDFLLNNKNVAEFLNKLCKTFEKYGLAVLTHNYVSSKGGRIDPLEYVIVSETKDYLVSNFNLSPLNQIEIKELTLLYTFYQIKDEILEIEDDDRRRNSFWNLLQGLPFDESSIQKLAKEFEEEKIITRYQRISEEKFLFNILNKKKFEEKLNSLVDEFVLGISRDLVSDGDLVKAKDIFQLHSELFSLIGNYEVKIRKYILNEMKTEFFKNGGDWETCLKKIGSLKKLESRKNQDIENGMMPEEELVYYADILDYRDIIFENWDTFSDKLLKKGVDLDSLNHGLSEINRIRRKVMHLREIRKGESDTLKFFILPKLEKIFS